MADAPQNSLHRKFSRRRLLGLGLIGAPLVLAADAIALEPNWLKVRQVNLASGTPTHRLVHFTDVHYRGNREQLEDIVARINALSPDFVCFTGDLIEDTAHLPEALQILRGIKSPLYGVPGNHDYWAEPEWGLFHEAFAATGGAWLMEETALTKDGKVQIIGITCVEKPSVPVRQDTRNILLHHLPSWIKHLGPLKLDLSLAGHSHGGQVRIPFYGALVLPFGVDEYDLGLFQTKAGPLYVNPGCGYFYMNVRFNCRPEITVIEI